MTSNENTNLREILVKQNFHRFIINRFLQNFVFVVFTKLIIYLFIVNTFTPIEKCAIIFVIAQIEKLLIGQKVQKLHNCARCNSSLIEICCKLY